MGVSDESDDEWNASQVPSVFLLTGTSSPQSPQSNDSTSLVSRILPNQKNKLQASTTIVHRKKTKQKVSKKKLQISKNVQRETPLLNAPISASENNNALNVVQITEELKKCVVEQINKLEKKEVVLPFDVCNFLQTLPLHFILLNRRKLNQAMQPIQNIPIFAKKGMKQFEEYSFCIVTDHAPKTINDFFIDAQLYRVTDPLVKTYVCAWNANDPNPHILNVASFFHTHPQIVSDLIHFTLCVAKMIYS